MVYGSHLTIIPGDRDCIPTHFCDNAAVSGITSPINSVAFLETFRFDGVHRPILIVPSPVRAMSALTPKADICPQIADVRFVPVADVASPTVNQLLTGPAHTVACIIHLQG
jgi:hypothetical protein